ncbi:MAG: ABC transporter ATP-binding protein, partial [Frankiales bacterium]|nr:ABC transporter ATP-binding protein [Frankiales bacterium]
GKTTLLRVLAGFDRPDGGEVTLDGKLVEGLGTSTPARGRRIGYVPQEGALFTHLTVAANIGFGVPRSTRTSRTAEMLDLVGLRALAQRRPDELSGGQQQRVALARALAVAPRLVLLDEPFSALDPGTREQVRTDVLALLRGTGTTALLVTHDKEEALSAADQVAVMDHGVVLQTDTPQQLHTRPASPEVAQFLGTGTQLPAIRTADGQVTCPLGEVATQAGPGRTEAAAVRTLGTVLVRSDQLVLTPAGTGPPRPAVTGTVIAFAFYGHDQLVTVLLDAAPRFSLGAEPHQDPAPPAVAWQVQARCPGDEHVTVGASVTVTVRGPVIFYPVG